LEAVEKTQKEVECTCGCGEFIKKYSPNGVRRYYKQGHSGGRKRDIDKLGYYVCHWCGESFVKYKCSVRSVLVFCSLSCRARWTGDKLKNDSEYKERQRQLIKSKGNIPPKQEGGNHWNWKGGISKSNRGQDYKYKLWVRSVLAKDNFICGICGERGGKLSGHHIKSWVESPELRYLVDNGQCLCYQCHMRLHGLNKKFRTLSKVEKKKK